MPSNICTYPSRGLFFYIISQPYTISLSQACLAFAAWDMTLLDMTVMIVYTDDRHSRYLTWEQIDDLVHPENKTRHLGKSLDE